MVVTSKRRLRISYYCYLMQVATIGNIISTYLCVCSCSCGCVRVCVCVRECMCICAYMCARACMRVCMCVRVYLCVWGCVCEITLLSLSLSRCLSFIEYLNSSFSHPSIHHTIPNEPPHSVLYADRQTRAENRTDTQTPRLSIDRPP